MPSRATHRSKLLLGIFVFIKSNFGFLMNGGVELVTYIQQDGWQARVVRVGARAVSLRLTFSFPFAS